jgi:hypothetical protein
MITYYDKAGKEITEQEWELLFTEYGYEQVRRSILAAGKTTIRCLDSMVR